MNQKFRFTIVALVIVLGLGTAGFNAWRRHQREDQLATLAKKASDDDARLRGLEARRRETQARLEKRIHDAEAAQSAMAQAGASESARRQTNRFLGTITQQYAALFRRLGLSSDQIAKFKAILKESSQRSGELRDAARSQGMKFTDPPIQAMEDQDRTQMQIQLADLLGPSAYQQYLDYSHAAPIRSLSATLASQLYYGAMPLTAAQGDQVIAILANLSPDYQKGIPANDLDSIDWTTAFGQARNILSPDQESALENSVDFMRTENQMNAMVRAIIRQRAGAEPGNNAPVNNR